MPKRKKPQGLQNHPQLQRIIEAYLDGQSPRKIASWCKPAVSHTAIFNYAKNTIDPTMANAEALKSVLPQNKIENTVVRGEEQQEEQPLQLVTSAITGMPVLTVRENRIKALEDRHRRLQMIVDERATEMDGECAGGASGFMLRDYKGKDADTKVYKVDTGLLSEFREHERQVAIEAGQWEAQHAPQLAIQIVMPQGTGAKDYPVIDIALPERPRR